ncbi:acyl carrier protein [Sorangium cellulosum]|uniref:Acyl carrier protein n=1 Tax=Sorangium cellulosum TaxID=56 RepID=A0A2L0F5R8_SORCE|nr:phosphopantetheine-binding protein [Sorangium cellulosum]AUX46867.1 acyl carrier protein [Sorangium cellulosum]
MTWTRETLRAEIIKLLEGHTTGEVKVTESSHLVADLSIDSLGVMEIVADMEDKFDLTIPDEVLREVDTVADVVKTIELRLKNEGRLSG